jgi:hypothetical protein
MMMMRVGSGGCMYIVELAGMNINYDDLLSSSSSSSIINNKKNIYYCFFVD